MNNMPRLAIVGTNSGCGKTTTALALESALLNRGLPVTAFKCGPDYIDGAFHRKVQHINCYNLDSIFLKDNELKDHFIRKATNKFSIIEGAMGMFDGVGAEGRCSSFEISKKISAPIILVINARGMSTSVRAIIRGFKQYSKDSISGIIFTNISVMSFPLLEECCIEEKINCYGFLPTDKKIVFESRHLGLIGSREIEDFNDKIEYLSSLAEKYIKIDELIKLANSTVTLESKKVFKVKLAKDVHLGLRIAIARDDAFCFTYQENLELMEEKGLEIVYFSPLTDGSLPINISGLYLPGGYPELHLEKLSSNKTLLAEIKEKIKCGLPTLAECGGFLYLHSNVDKKALVSLFEESAIKGNHLQNFGYSSLESNNDNLLFKKGEKTFVHEFHYYVSTDDGTSCIVTKLKNGRQRDCVIATDTLFAGFPHLYFLSNPKMVDRLITHMEKYKKGINH